MGLGSAGYDVNPRATIRTAFRFALLAVVGLTQVARAEVFCVNSTVALQAAFDAAATNGEDDSIRILAGNMPGATVFDSSEPFAIAVSGGWGTACATISAGTTFLDGQEQVQVMRIDNLYGDVSVQRISFVNGLASNLKLGGGLFASSSSGDVRIDLNRFINNAGTIESGALRVVSGAGMSVRNNLFYANSSASKGAVTLLKDSGVAYVNGNTIFGNQYTLPLDGGASGLYLGPTTLSGGSATFILSNNILWGNADGGSVDLQAAAHHYRIANDVGVVYGEYAEPDILLYELSTDPGFVDCVIPCPFPDFELSVDSPLVDAGVDNAAGGLTNVDLSRKPRQVGTAVDIGAYENDYMVFSDDFETE